MTNNAIFNVVLYEAIHGEIETIDPAAESRKQARERQKERNRKILSFHRQKAQKAKQEALRVQKTITLFSLLFAIVSGLIALFVPGMGEAIAATLIFLFVALSIGNATRKKKIVVTL